MGDWQRRELSWWSRPLSISEKLHTVYIQVFSVHDSGVWTLSELLTFIKLLNWSLTAVSGPWWLHGLGAGCSSQSPGESAISALDWPMPDFAVDVPWSECSSASTSS